MQNDEILRKIKQVEDNLQTLNTKKMRIDVQIESVKEQKAKLESEVMERFKTLDPEALAQIKQKHISDLAALETSL